MLSPPRPVRFDLTQTVLGLVALALLVALILPASPVYRTFVRSLRNHGYISIVYYLNYSDPALAIEEGNYFFGGGAYDQGKATRAYQLALQLDPTTKLAHYQLARIYYVEGDFTKATTEINAELALDPYNVRSLYVRGLIEISQYNFSAAEADFSRFVRWAPTEWAGYNDLAFVFAKEGKYAESDAAIRQAFMQVPDAQDIPWLWNSLGLAQLNELHYTQAANSFEKALALAKETTPQEWHRAYSGNDPATISADLMTFQNAIQSNLLIAQKGSTL